VLELWSELTLRGLGEYTQSILESGDAYIQDGGHFGSINHDTYDHHECVAYAVAFRIFQKAGRIMNRTDWITFAHQIAIPGLDHFRMDDNRHGIPTKDLLWMETSWNTAYLWENAEAALAYLEAWVDRGNPDHLQAGVDILQTAGKHHHGEMGFLTEGVDWDNHVSPRHHIQHALYEDICYTEPLLNNLHILAPTLFYFQHTHFSPPQDLDDQVSIQFLNTQRKTSRYPSKGSEGVRYLLRFYFPALATEERLLQALDFTRRSGADGVLLFEASYDMDPAILSLEILSERFKRLKKIVPRFRKLVKEVHINVMITLGHVDMGSARPERFPFQFMVDEYGNTSRSTACPLDPDFVQHIAELYRLAADCRADAVWVDDDTRFLLHDHPGMNCFCPLHLDAIQRLSGRIWSRSDLVRALQDDNINPELRKLWFDLQENAILELARTIEKSVHLIDPKQSIGLMSVGQSFHAAEGRNTDRLLRTLAGKNQPLFRPGSGFWNDERPLAGLEKAEGCARELAFLGYDVRSVSEVENHPYTPFGKSERALELELVMDVLCGMPDLSLNILTSMGGSSPLEPEGTNYADFLLKHRPYLNALAVEWSGKIRQGIGISDHADYARHAKINQGSLMGWVQSRPWETLLARLGFPIGHPDHAPHWLIGDVIHSLSDYELNWHLYEGAVLDPVAARGLLERGWGKPIGLESVQPIRDAVNEILTEDPMNGKHSGEIMPVYNHISPDHLYTFRVSNPRARIISQWLDVDRNNQGCALTYIESPGFMKPDWLLTNPDHFKITLLPYALSSTTTVLLNLARRELWASILEIMSGKPLPCRITRGVNLYPYAFESPDRKNWLISVVNLSADDVQQAELILPALGTSQWSVEHLLLDGSWRDYSYRPGNLIEFQIRSFSSVVFRFRKS